MIAFKPYSLAPSEQRPVGIPLQIPWIMSSIDEENAEKYKANGFVVMSDGEYSDFVAAMQPDIDAYEAAKTTLAVEQSVSAARDFGMRLMVNFAAENVLLGITQEGKTGEVLTKMAPVMTPLQSGSLYEAIAQMRAIPSEQYDTKYITAARLLSGINKIETYLGIPLSESL